MAHPIPLPRDEGRFDCAIGWIDKTSQHPVILFRVNAVNTLLLKSSDARAKASAQHYERGEVDFDISVGVGVMFLYVQIRFVIEQAVQNERRITVSTLNWDAAIWCVVIRKEGIDQKLVSNLDY